MSVHMVTGPLAIVKDATGKQRYYYGGTTLPEDLPDAEVSRLVDLGLVSKVPDPLTVELVPVVDRSVDLSVSEPVASEPAPAKRAPAKS